MPKRKRTVDESLSDSPAASPEPGFELIPPKNQAAADLGRRGGLKGGVMRAARMTPEARSLSARAAASARWAKPPKGLLTRPPDDQALEGEVLPPSPFAKHRGTTELNGNLVDVYVLDTDQRVISLRAVVKVLTGVDGGVLEDYIGVKALKEFVNSDLVLEESVDFYIPGTQFRGRGITAEQFEAILSGYVRALHAGALKTDRQKEIAVNCAVLSTSFLRVGIIALIDEATGYQYERAADALEIKYKAYVAEELREWEPTFPDELWEQFGRLTGWKGSLHKRPKWWGHLVNELIYEAMDPDIAKYLRDNKPKPFHGQNYHQWLTKDVGLKALIPHIYKIIGMAENCRDMRELRDRVAERYGKKRVQFTMYLPPQSRDA